MAKKYNQGVSVSSARFTQAPMGEIEFSKLYGEPSLSTTMNAGDIVPIYCAEVLPHSTFSIGVDEVIRQATLSVPVMDRACIDIFAYFVPNRVVNKSWKSVMGENANGSWTASKVSLAPLGRSDIIQNIKVPVGSVADYYGYPTQGLLSGTLLSSMHDLKFRGYLEIYNNYFRDQNYQPPIPYSKLNVYNGFFENKYAMISYNGSGANLFIEDNVPADNSYGAGAIQYALHGGDLPIEGETSIIAYRRQTAWSALSAPLKANKLHDYFTSVLPSPQKGEEVIIGLGETAPVVIDTTENPETFSSGIPLRIRVKGGLTSDDGPLYVGAASMTDSVSELRMYHIDYETDMQVKGQINASNLIGYADLSQSTGVSIADLRMSAAIQQVYEIMGRGGTRYTEYINSFFGLDIDNPFNDIPTCLGHIRRNLDLYQTAQTSASTEESPQGSLSAFGYTSTGGDLFTRTFLEHGYIHMFAVIRHRNIYPALLSRDNFRLEQMDFYQYPLANISEQPVYTREINPFYSNPEQVFGYQEAWAEYRMEPDRVSGYMRTGIDGSLSQWNYADSFDSSLAIADGDWLQSNTDGVMRRSTALTDQELPQFKAKFTFKIHKQLPMPTYSMSGLDIF